MFTIIRSISVPVLTILFTFNSSFAWAAENSAPSLLPSTWPLILLVVILVIFRKPLFYAYSFEQQARPTSLAEFNPIESCSPQEAATVDTKANNAIVDLKD
ncbi:MAG: hypothetical protein KAJ63_05270 [Methyloprofundus sp.]|nr:hypothetical protein [Methyloprofundus sp.]